MTLTVRFKRGLKKDLPTEPKEGQLLVTTDTREVFVGKDGRPQQITDIRQLAEMPAEGVNL